MSISDNVRLHGTVDMPLFGLGTYLSPDGDAVENAVRWSLEAGYRLIDTATIYRNEAGVGRAVRDSGIPRSDVFVTTKLWNTEQGYETALRAFDESLRRLGFDYVDLYLVHWPVPEKTADTWRALEHLYAEGLTKAIGVSNFQPHHLDQLIAGADVAPSVNQVELHPHFQQLDVRAADSAIGCVTQAWSPLKRGEVANDPAIAAIAERHDATAAQVVVAWALQSGISTIPKSVKRHRIVENAGGASLTLTPGEIGEIAALDRGERTGPDPDDRDF